MVLASKKITRKTNADSFFTESVKTALKPGEILTEVDVPLQTGRFGGAYFKVKKGSGGYSIAGVASCLSIADDDGAISGCRIGLTAVGPKTLRAEKAEQALLGKVPKPPVLDEAAALAVKDSKPFSDSNASESYRRKVLYKLVKDAVEAAYSRATEGR
jgi:CO/xanthine dehydrogenase FAD-binding subunit